MHGALESARIFQRPAIHPNLVVIAVRDEAALQRANDKLISQGVALAAWREPDLGGSLTSIASAPVSGNGRLPFRRYQLIKENNFATKSHSANGTR